MRLFFFHCPHLSLALDLRPPLKPLAVPRECSTRILKQIETKIKCLKIKLTDSNSYTVRFLVNNKHINYMSDTVMLLFKKLNLLAYKVS